MAVSRRSRFILLAMLGYVVLAGAAIPLVALAPRLFKNPGPVVRIDVPWMLRADPRGYEPVRETHEFAVYAWTVAPPGAYWLGAGEPVPTTGIP